VDRPYSIGYSVLDDSLQSNLQIAKMINYAGYTITASADSVSYAVMEKGGNFDSNYNAFIVDSLSHNAWPMSGYTYLVLRGNYHIGDCYRRQEAMEYLYNFYKSDTLKVIANTHGFATLPDFIRDLVITRMINKLFCTDGSYALAAHRALSRPIITLTPLSSLVNTYLTAYLNVQPTNNMDVLLDTTSDSIVSTYKLNPVGYVGIFTLFSSRAKKIDNLVSDSNILTSAFAHVALVVLFHLNTFTAVSATLSVTAEILGGIYSGDITRWNDPLIVAANSAYAAYLPSSRIYVVEFNNCEFETYENDSDGLPLSPTFG